MIRAIKSLLLSKSRFIEWVKVLHCIFSYNFQEVFTYYPDHGIFWLDAAIRFLTSDLTKLQSKAAQNGGMVRFVLGSDTIFPVTHPHTLKYLITSIRGIQTMSQSTGTTFLVYNTVSLYQYFLWPLYLCALDPQCIAPTSDVLCSGRLRLLTLKTMYAGCHRYDQAVMSILALNMFAFDQSCFASTQAAPYLKIMKTSTENNLTIAECS